MNIRLISAILICSSCFSVVSRLSAEDGDESAQVGKRLIEALEAYNKSEGVEALSFFSKRKMLTKSLEAAMKRGFHLDSDPFLQAQDTVAGFVIKDVKIGDGVARVVVAHKPTEWDKGGEGVTFIMLKEDDLWKIDDIDWGDGTLKQACR